MPLPIPRVKVPAPPPGLRDWAIALRRRHLFVFVSHPHHYSVALGVTVFLFAVGHFEAGAIWTAWGYAVFENLATAAEGVITDARVAAELEATRELTQ